MNLAWIAEPFVREFALPAITEVFPYGKKIHVLEGPKQGRKGSPARSRSGRASPRSFGKFSIYGFEGRGPQRGGCGNWCGGKLNGRVAPLGARAFPVSDRGCAELSLSLRLPGTTGAFTERKFSEAPSGILLYLAPRKGRGHRADEQVGALMNCRTAGWIPWRLNESLGFAADARDYEIPRKDF